MLQEVSNSLQFLHCSAEERLEQHKLHKLAGSPAMRKMAGTVGVGQFFGAEKLAVAARKEEVNDIVWTNEQKAKYWGGGEVERAQNFRQAFCAPWKGSLKDL